jgi:peptide/nickel transport system permease protein
MVEAAPQTIDAASASAFEASAPPRATRSRLRRLLRNPTALLALVTLALLVGAASFAPFITRYNPLAINPAFRFRPPGAQHLFGTDHLGRDIFAIVLYGGRTSLFVGASVMIVAMAIAILLGLLAGFYRGLDAVLMRFVDGIMAFPGIVLATAATGYLGPSVETVVIALSIVLIAPALRVVRGQVLIARELPMIEAARAVGVPERRILTRYMLPAALSPILVQASFIFSAAVLGEAALSFIGLGVGPRDVSWGGALTEARNYVANAWWMLVFPGAALVLAILALNLLGDALRDALDPRQARR